MVIQRANKRCPNNNDVIECLGQKPFDVTEILDRQKPCDVTKQQNAPGSAPHHNLASSSLSQ